MPPTKTWKQRERSVARMLGAERNPLSGRNSGRTASDSSHSEFFIETKHRKRHAILTVWDQAARHAKREGKIPVVALTQHGRPGCWWVIRSQDLNTLIAGIQDRDAEKARQVLERRFIPVKKSKQDSEDEEE